MFRVVVGIAMEDVEGIMKGLRLSAAKRKCMKIQVEESAKVAAWGPPDRKW